MIPLYTSQQVRDADNYAVNILNMPSIVLMENAARSIYDSIIEFIGNTAGVKVIGIVCGKGNNGGDGFALARHFINNGFCVTVISLGAEDELKGDALTNLRILNNMLNDYPVSKLLVYQNPKDLSVLENCSIIVDAMLGTGSRGILGEPYKEIVEKLNTIDAYKIAVDLPTGLDIEVSWGDVIFNADLTVTLSEYKTGLFYGKGYVHSGVIKKGVIGMDPGYYQKLSVTDYLIEPEDAYYGLPSKSLDLHKYSAGKVLVIAGSNKLPGAAFFAANTVLKTGAGSCVLAFPKSISVIAQQKLDAPILISYDDSGRGFLIKDNIKELESRIDWADVIAIGPGLGREDETKEAVLEILRTYKNKKFVIDADAIFALGKEDYKKLNLKNKILTPHHKEFAEMIGVELHDLENNILSLGRNFAQENLCYLVLKGAPTIIFNAGGEAFINSTGNPGLAKFGTGDVLTGAIASFQAQSEDVEDALISSIYFHSLAADLLAEEKSEYGYTATDLMEKIPNAIKFILNSFIQ